MIVNGTKDPLRSILRRYEVVAPDTFHHVQDSQAPCGRLFARSSTLLRRRVRTAPEPQVSLHFNMAALITKAKDALAPGDPEVFKAFLLGVMVGLRRKEIDLLEWDSFLWNAGVVRVQATQHFDAKTEDSLGDVAVDIELLEVFRGYRARATSAFVIESRDEPKPGASYSHYRCQEVFDRLINWLRQNDVKGNKPLHTLRKEFGSQVCAAHGVHAASRQLRHADIAITNMFYTDARKRALTGLGHLLKSDNKVVSLPKDQTAPSRTGDSLALGTN